MKCIPRGPRGLCVSRYYKNCPPIRNGIAGGLRKSAHHETPPICSCLVGLGKIDPTEHIKHFLSPTLTFGSNFVTATVAVSSNFVTATVAVGSNFEESRSLRDGRKLRRATQSSGESFPRPCSQASAFSSLHKSDFGTAMEQADKIKRWFERMDPRFDSAKCRFERTSPRFDSEVVKTRYKIGPTDSYKRVMQNMLNIKARPYIADNKVFPKPSLLKMKGYLLHITENQSIPEGPPSVDFDNFDGEQV